MSNSERYIFPNKETNSILTIAKTVSNIKTYISLQTESLSSKLWKIYLSWQRNREYFEKLQSMFQTMKHICIHRSWQRNSKYFEKLQKLFQTMTKYIYFDREAESVFKSYKNCFKQKIIAHCTCNVPLRLCAKCGW